jgi:hypothetical protein
MSNNSDGREPEFLSMLSMLFAIIATCLLYSNYEDNTYNWKLTLSMSIIVAIISNVIAGVLAFLTGWRTIFFASFFYGICLVIYHYKMHSGPWTYAHSLGVLGAAILTYIIAFIIDALIDN